MNYQDIQDELNRIKEAADMVAGLIPNNMTEAQNDNWLRNFAAIGNKLAGHAEHFDYLATYEHRKQQEQAKERRTETRFHDDCAILPVGRVNLDTGKNAMFGQIWNCWEEGKGTCYLLTMNEDGKAKFRVVNTSDSDAVNSDHTIVGDTLRLVHDQDGYNMGAWTVVAIAPHSKIGHKRLKEVSGKVSLSFSTFK